MTHIRKKPYTEGSTTFDPDTFFESWKKEELTPPYDNDFRKFIIKAFGLTARDVYVYKAVAEVTLLQTQTYLEFGAQGGLHGWYKDENGEARPPPPATDISAYTSLFRPTTQTPKALTALSSNAKKSSIRADVAQHLSEHYSPPAPTRNLVVPRSKSHVNPYFDVWAWSNQNLEWAGPERNTVNVKISHALLPVIYHHFGCACPSYEALELISQLSRGREVIDMGSGNGYWSYMLRRFGSDVGRKAELKVIPVDDGTSEWRTMWVGDTIVAEGETWLKQRKRRGGGKDEALLLLVYPSVGKGFTERVIKAYGGTTIVSAGSQNANGFTAFAQETIAEWMAREMPGWEKILQIPLPSFAGKDEALFVFEKKKE